MSLYVVSRRKVVFQQAGTGGSLVVYVPSADQIQVLKDAAGTTVAVKSANSPSSGRGPQLVRVLRGQRTLYGTLPQEILELRQSVKVWLAEDLAPPAAEAFFYVFSPQVVVHGIRERNDEGRLMWRTAQLQLPAGEAALDALNIILADYSLANPGQNVCVAVVNDTTLFRTMQQGAAAHGFTPVPFSTLRPSPEVDPLYKHGNFTWLYLLLVALGVIGVLVVGILWTAELGKARDLERQIEEIEFKIQAVQINKRTGHIRQPDAVLNEIKAGVAVSPSALIQASAGAVAAMGEIQQIALGQASSLDTEAGIQVLPEWQLMKITLNNPVESLLVDQATLAREVLANQPWVRQVVRQGQGSESQQLDLILMLQVTGTVPPVVLPDEVVQVNPSPTVPAVTVSGGQP